MQNINEIDELIKIISKLPGLGPKSARRIILKLINNKVSKYETKVIKATASITPGIAYPDTEKVVKASRNLLLDTLFP